MTARIPLYRAFPNPFNQSTRIAYAVEAVSGSPVAISVFDVSGRQVRELVNETKSPGRYEASWDGRDASGAQAPGGIYFFRVVVGNEVKPVSRILYLR